MRPKQFVVYELKFRDNSSHVCNVTFHRTLVGMRNLLTKRGHKDSSHTNACCWQTGKVELTKHGWVIAEMHFAMGSISDETIVHECVHAALHRVRLMSYTDDDWNEEELAETCGRLVEQVKSLKHKVLAVMER